MAVNAEALFFTLQNICKRHICPLYSSWITWLQLHGFSHQIRQKERI